MNHLQWVIDNCPLPEEPGREVHYSNVGYMFLARIVEKVSGMYFADFINTYLMAPIGVTSFTLCYDEQHKRLPNEVTYYSIMKESSPYSLQFRRADGATGMVISPTDMVKFTHAYLHAPYTFRGSVNGVQTFIWNTTGGR